MNLTLDQQIMARVLDLLSGVSEARLKRAIKGGPQSDVLVSPRVLGVLAVLMEQRAPGALKYVRTENEKYRAERAAARKAQS